MKASGRAAGRARRGAVAAGLAAALLSAAAAGWAADGDLQGRHKALLDAESFILDEAARLNAARQSGGGEDAAPTVPEELRQPWALEPTLERRAREGDWHPDYRARRTREMARDTQEVLAALRGAVFGQTSAAYAERTEYRDKFTWLQGINRSIGEKIGALKGANPALRAVLEKEIELDLERAQRLACLWVRCETPETAPAGAPAGAGAQAAPPPRPRLPDLGAEREPGAGAPKSGLSPSTGFASGMLYEAGLHHERLEQRSAERDVESALSEARAAFGTGKAGGGGVSLHEPAVVEGLDAKAIERAALDNGRLVLITRSGERIMVPEVPLADLAVAIRATQGPQSSLEGVFKARDGETLIVETGAERFGEVAWRASYLPLPPGRLRPGDEVRLAVPPAIGMMSLPEPSMSRVTYYGPIRETRLGSVLFHADRVLGILSRGVDAESGQPVDLASIGVASLTGRKARSEAKGDAGAPERKAASGVTKDRHANAWWRQTFWLVWVSDGVRFRYDSAAKRIDLVSGGVRLEAWTSDPGGVGRDVEEFVAGVNARLPTLAERYPALADLGELAPVVALARWMWVNYIPVDPALEEADAGPPVETPERLRDIFVYAPKDKGRPQFRARAEP